jgi:hypothetical protein
MFLGLLDPNPDPIVRGMDPDTDLSSSKNSRKKSKNRKNVFKKLVFCRYLEGQ